jgi:hypothetical protein
MVGAVTARSPCLVEFDVPRHAPPNENGPGPAPGAAQPAETYA